MNYVVTAEEMRRFDANTIEKIGIPAGVLMERAALALRDRVLSVCENMRFEGKCRTQAHVLILAGMGNNGGDGLALARLLTECDMQVEVWCVGTAAKASHLWQKQRRILDAYEIIFSDKPTRNEYTILVDALFGVGLSREVEGGFKDAIECFNNLEGYKIAADVPSGICSDTGKVLGCGVSVDETVTFAYAKRGLYLYPGCSYAGKVTVAEIGITERSFQGQKPQMYYPDRDLKRWLPKRSDAGNKGTFGKLLLIAGSAGMAGAAILAAKAAYRVGAGMVKVITDESNRVVLQETIPEAMFDTYDGLDSALSWADIVAIGPGIGQGGQAVQCVEKVLCHAEKPLLIDADGLNILAGHRALFERLSDKANRTVVLTPHVGELARLTGCTIEALKANLWQYAMDLAVKSKVIVVAKDARSFVCADKKPVCLNVYGNQGMATAGSGDVLAGIIAGLWGQYDLKNDDPLDAGFRAACAGMCLHGLAGDLVAGKKGPHGLMAGDLPDAAAELMKASAAYER